MDKSIHHGGTEIRRNLLISTVLPKQTQRFIVIIAYEEPASAEYEVQHCSIERPADNNLSEENEYAAFKTHAEQSTQHLLQIQGNAIQNKWSDDRRNESQNRHEKEPFRLITNGFLQCVRLECGDQPLLPPAEFYTKKAAENLQQPPSGNYTITLLLNSSMTQRPNHPMTLTTAGRHFPAPWAGPSCS